MVKPAPFAKSLR